MIDPLTSLLKMAASLLVVIGLIGATAYVARRYFGERLGMWRAQPVIQVLARTHLGSRREVALVEVGNTCLVLGVTPTQISMLAQVERPSTAPAAATHSERRGVMTS